MRRLPAALIVTAVVALLPVPCHAAPPETPAKVLTLHPAAEPVPALKYRLLPIFIDQEPGNAASEYKELTQEFEQGGVQWDEAMFDTWRQMPLSDLPVQDVRQALAPLEPYLSRLARAARREKCDWERPIREDGLNTLLPELQPCREFARMLALKARVHMAEGRFGEAAEALQTGFALAHHVSEGPSLIESLVAIAMASIMTEQVADFVQAPGAPNLYWALTALPRPFVDARKAMEIDMNMVFLQWPRLRDLTKPGLTAQEARVIMAEVFADLPQIGEMPRPDDLAGRLAPTALAMAGYVPAKQYLIAQGWPPEKVEAMPVLQVVGIHFRDVWQREADGQLKWFYVPYPEAREALERYEGPKMDHTTGMGEILLAMLMPALSKAHAEAACMDRRIAALRCIEAVRMYAAAHDGRLPATLSDVTEVPIPENPMTGEGFDYELAGDWAVLSSPVSKGERPVWAIHYELTIAEEPGVMED